MIAFTAAGFAKKGVQNQKGTVKAVPNTLGGDCMKRIIAISAMFALLVGAAFAADVSGHVIGTATLIDMSTAQDAEGVKADAGAGGGMDRIRAEASGGSDDGKWGGWVRIEGNGMAGNAWWQPIDQLLVRIGSNGGDGYYGKEGVTGWGFYQTVTDTGVAFAGENVWGWHLNGAVSGFTQGHSTRTAFYGGFGDNGLMLEIKPIDLLGINLVLPFAGGTAKDFYKNILAQIDLNFGFGNIALTFDSGAGWSDIDADPDPGKVYLYFGGSFGSIGIDFGFAYGFPVTDDATGFYKYYSPMGIGLGFKFDNGGLFGIKARVTASLAEKYTVTGFGDEKIPLGLIFDILPYLKFNDNFSLFLSGGIVMTGKGDWEGAESQLAWHVNPYIQIGSEWGPKFLAGIKLWQTPEKDGKGNKFINFSVPVALNVGF